MRVIAFNARPKLEPDVTATPAASYLDYNATTPVLPEVAAAVSEALTTFGNPSSVHGFGRRARGRVEEAREAVAAMVGGWRLWRRRG